ncbi:hypothetical protein KIN20_030461 [Parelaphostrongylus tenuis]|uniref:Kinetochore protein Nuf2 N-terminal domain-containing protein n=1 Tax=Parelaphostrongylus tenuis TaxID=148309 RepID=A0AAD5R4U6_PARTN|nr:hypothetical protein KIN20_030461 [Parelaphostrongylus tenuis]
MKDSLRPSQGQLDNQLFLRTARARQSCKLFSATLNLGNHFRSILSTAVRPIAPSSINLAHRFANTFYARFVHAWTVENVRTFQSFSDLLDSTRPMIYCERQYDDFTVDDLTDPKPERTRKLFSILADFANIYAKASVAFVEGKAEYNKLRRTVGNGQKENEVNDLDYRRASFSVSRGDYMYQMLKMKVNLYSHSTAAGKFWTTLSTQLMTKCRWY